MTEPLWKMVFRAEDTTEDLNSYIIPQSHTIPYGNRTQVTQKSIEHTHTHKINLQPYDPGHISSQKLGKLDLVSTCMGDLFTFILIFINVFMFCLNVCVKASSDSLKLNL